MWNLFHPNSDRMKSKLLSASLDPDCHDRRQTGLRRGWHVQCTCMHMLIKHTHKHLVFKHTHTHIHTYTHRCICCIISSLWFFCRSSTTRRVSLAWWGRYSLIRWCILMNNTLRFWILVLRSGDAGLKISMSNSSRKHISMDRFSFFSSAFLSVDREIE